MNIKLLQKIEEMTIYIIEQQKQNSKQSKEIEFVNQKLLALENFINSKLKP
jgi:uncharacterized coiled-coil protein SlyX